MIAFLHLPHRPLDHTRGWRALRQFAAVVTVLTIIDQGSACAAPGKPQCFRRSTDDTNYICEWSRSATNGTVTYDLFFNTTYAPFIVEEEVNIATNWTRLDDDRLIRNRNVSIWTKAHVGNSSCLSDVTIVLLSSIVKYATPQNILASWSSDRLNLTWKSVNKEQASVNVLLRGIGDAAPRAREYNFKMDATNNAKYTVILEGLQRHSAYKVQARQRSTMALKSLWSDWSPVQDVPAEIDQPPELLLRSEKDFENGTRFLMLTWKGVPPAAAIGGVNYSVKNSQSSLGCPCLDRVNKKNAQSSLQYTEYSTYLTYSAVNISIITINTAGKSSPTHFHLPDKWTNDLKACDGPILHGKVPKHTCLQWYEYQDETNRPHTVNTLKAKEGYKKMKKKMKDYVRYVYLEHICVDEMIPQTKNMCLLYKKEGGKYVTMEPTELCEDILLPVDKVNDSENGL